MLKKDNQDNVAGYISDKCEDDPDELTAAGLGSVMVMVNDKMGQDKETGPAVMVAATAKCIVDTVGKEYDDAETMAFDYARALRKCIEDYAREAEITLHPVKIMAKA